MNRLVLLFVTAICFFCSCSPAKKIQTTIPEKDTIAVAVIVPTGDPRQDSVVFIKKIYKQVLDNHINFTTFSAKVDVDYKDTDGKEYNITAHLRMYKDSVIWFSVTGALGIEGLRAYITADSVKLLDKQNKEYVARSLSYLQDVIALPLDLVSLQDLLLGNPVFLDSTIISYSQSGNSISLLSKGEFIKNSFTIDETGKLVQSSKLDNVDEGQNRSCFLTYAEYQNKAGVNFSTKRTINVTDKKKLDIKLDFRQYAFNEKLSFPFSVPKNYQRN